MNIHDTMQTLEQLRKKSKSLTTLFGVGIALLFAVMILPSLLLPFRENAALLTFTLANLCSFLLPCAIVLFAIMKHSTQKKFDQLYKETFVPGVLKQFFEEVTYEGNRGFQPLEVKNFGLVTLGNVFRSEDLITGKYRGILFRQADVVILQKSKNSSSTHFRGRMFAFDFPRAKTPSLQVHSKNFSYRAASPIGFKLTNVEMEDVAFNRNFQIRGTSPHDAFYILTPPMMEKITAIYQRYGNLALHFGGRMVYVGINTTSDAFDADMKKPLSYPDEVAKIRQDTQVITDIIDMLSDSFPEEEPS